MKNQLNRSCDSEKGDSKDLKVISELEEQIQYLRLAREKAEEALKESQEKYNILFENSPVGKSITFLDGSINVNTAFCNLLGYDKYELSSKKWFDITYPEDVDESKEIIEELLSGRKYSYRYEKRYIHKDGKIVWTDVSTALQRDSSGEPKYFVTIIVDITHRKVLEKEISDNEKRFREIIESLPQLFWTCKADGPCDYLSKQWVEYTGIPESEQLDYRWLEQLHQEDREKTVSAWMEKVKTGNFFDIEFRIRRNDGRFHWFKTRAVPIRNSQGEITKWLGSNTDIDDIKNAENQLINLSRELEQKVQSRTKELENATLYNRSLFEASIDPLILIGADGKIFDVNESAETITGFSREILIGTDFSSYFTDPVRASEGYRKVFKEGITRNFSLEIKNKNGQTTPIQFNASIFKSLQGKFEVVLVVIRDISEKIQIEEELRRSQKLLEETGRLAKVGGWEIDLKSNKLYWSKTTREIHEVEPDYEPELVSAINFYAPESIPVISECVEKAIRSGEPFDVELELITAKNNRIWVKAIGQAYLEKGEIVKVAGVFQDINARKLIENEIIRHRDHLEEIVQERTNELDKAIIDLRRSNQELEQFAYVASHDLQEPLRMISSYTQLIEKRYKDRLDQDANDFIFYAVDGASRMQQLINDLLEYSRVTTKGKPFNIVNLSEVLDQAVTILQRRILETGAHIISSGLSFAMGDEIQLVRVFQNLLENAIKFSREGPPVIKIQSIINGTEVLVSVADNGIGIDKIYSDRVFLIFQRLHSKAEYPGTGIGLSICKRIIERHNGKIWFESIPGQGTTFYFTLKIK